MTAPAQTAGPDDSITEAAGRLAAARIGTLPIVELGRLLGLVTVTDILDRGVVNEIVVYPPQVAPPDDIAQRLRRHENGRNARAFHLVVCGSQLALGLRQHQSPCAFRTS